MRDWRPRFALLLGFLLLAAGCQKEEYIERYTVPHPDRESLRMLGAIVPFQDMLWFFKLSGPADEVARQKKAFDEFVASLQFNPQEQPPLSYKVPASWQKEAGNGIRLFSFRIPAQPKELELTVTPLEREGNGILENVNRWRRQLNLPPLERAGLRDVATPMQVAGQDGYLVDMTGLGVHTVSKPAPAGRQPAPMARAPRPQAPELPFSYDVPADWDKDARPAGLSAASFTVRDGERKASVTLTRLGGQAGGLAGNVNRWRGQVGLPKVSEDELAKSMTPLDVAGERAWYVDLDNPGGPSADNRILGVILPLGEQTWFFKMTGPGDLVGRHKAEFESFVKSVKLGEKE